MGDFDLFRAADRKAAWHFQMTEITKVLLIVLSVLFPILRRLIYNDFYRQIEYTDIAILHLWRLLTTHNFIIPYHEIVIKLKISRTFGQDVQKRDILLGHVRQSYNYTYRGNFVYILSERGWVHAYHIKNSCFAVCGGAHNHGGRVRIHPVSLRVDILLGIVYYRVY